MNCNQSFGLTVNTLQSQIDGKAPLVHAHLMSDVSELTTTLTSMDSRLDVLENPAPFVLPIHQHTMADVTGLTQAIDAKVNTVDMASALLSKSDVGHVHAIAEVTNLQATLDAKANATDVTTALAAKADVIHTHVIADVIDLQVALDTKIDGAYPTVSGPTSVTVSTTVTLTVTNFDSYTPYTAIAGTGSIVNAGNGVFNYTAPATDGTDVVVINNRPITLTITL